MFSTKQMFTTNAYLKYTPMIYQIQMPSPPPYFYTFYLRMANSIQPYLVDWGDGTKELIQSSVASHTYPSTPATYTVKIQSEFFDHNVTDPTRANYFRAARPNITQWGDGKWIDMFNSFVNVTTLTSTATDYPNTAAVTDFNGTFGAAETFTGDAGFPNWNVSQATDMRFMFQGAWAFNRNISTWNVSNVTRMNSMFDEARAFNQNLGSWNIGSLTSASAMFSNSGMSTENYSRTLIGWANYVYANNKPLNLPFINQTNMKYNGTNYGGTPFSNAVDARNYLIGRGWTISGDIQV